MGMGTGVVIGGMGTMPPLIDVGGGGSGFSFSECSRTTYTHTATVENMHD